MVSQPPFDPRTVAGLRNFFADFFAKRRELGLDTDPEAERRMPEFFLTLPAAPTASDLTLNIYCEKDMPAAQEMEATFKELIPYRLTSNGLRVRRYQADEREKMYQDFSRSGATYYLHPAALHALAQLKVASDPYGLVALTLLWGHFLCFVAFVLMMWVAGEWDWAMLVAVALILVGTYFILNRLVNLQAIRATLSRKRSRQFAAVLGDCQLVAERHLDEALAAEIPPTVLSRLQRLPSQRPAPQDVLLAADWRLGEIWDLAHEAVRQLTKTPESSPLFPRLTLEVEQLLDKAALAFQATPVLTENHSSLNELYRQVNAHAEALGVGLPVSAHRQLIAEGHSE